MKAYFAGYITMASLLIGLWGWNAYKIGGCDWSLEAGTDLKCEVVHTVGLVPPLYLVTVWFGTDSAQ